jgi:pyridoxine 5-phosphate synthase
MTHLSVNVNKIALLRNSRTIGIPDVAHLARIALEAGAHGITVHPRPDGRHIRVPDVYQLRALVAERPSIEFNIEGNPFHDLLPLVRATRPHQCTLVPDAPGAPTSDHGWDLPRDGGRLEPLVAQMKALGTRVSLFMDPVAASMRAAREVGADRVELYTEPYARAFVGGDVAAELSRYAGAAQAATEAGLGVNAGHDLNCANLPGFLRAVPSVAEVSIGHALVSDALEFGLARTVQLYLEAIERGGG